jgi:tRNA G10  N-methylase Trm11
MTNKLRSREPVLNPFAGTGTTLKTAVEEGRDAIGVDLVPMMNLGAQR